MAKVIQVIESTTMRGNGRDDPFRTILQLWTLEGELLAEDDQCERCPHCQKRKDEPTGDGAEGEK